MQISTERLIRKFSLSVHRYHHAILLSLILIGFALRLHGLAARTLFGDEYNSIIEAETIGKNLQALIYSLILHFWLIVGEGDFLVRFPSVVFGVLAIPAAFRLGRAAIGLSTGITLALMISLSSFAIEYSQTTRFYSLFLFTSTCSLAFFIEFRQRPNTRRLLYWLLFTAVTLMSHLFGILVLVGELVVLWLDAAKGRQIWFRGLAVLSTIIVLAIALPILVNADTFSQLERLIGGKAPATQLQPRGLGIANVAKVPLTLYFFGLGQSFYPLDLPFALVGALLFLAAGLLGLRAIYSTRLTSLIILVFLGMVPLVFLVVDPAAPAFSETAAPRHVIAALPALFLLVAIGVSQSRFGTFFLIAIVLMQLYGLDKYYWGSWSYTVPVQVNWKNLETQLRAPENSLLLYDGRSTDAVERYFPNWQKRDFWSYRTGANIDDLNGFERVVLMTNDYREGTREEINRFLRVMEPRWNIQRGIVRYPVFAFVFKQKPKVLPEHFPVHLLTGQIGQPAEIYGLEFQDLDLPVSVNLSGKSYAIDTVFALPSAGVGRERTLQIDSTVQWNGLVLGTNLTMAQGINVGNSVAEIEIQMLDGTRLILPLKMGSEVNAWDQTCGKNDNCKILLSWHKRSALVGQRAYPEAWSDFSANVFETKLAFEHPSQVEAIKFRYLASSGQLNIWVVGLY